MARKVSNMPEVRVKYPWAEWLDGDVWELVPGEDFQCKSPAIRQGAQNYARKHGFTAVTAEQNGKIYVRAILNGTR